ncbi:hypothetical protein ABZ897_47445 [Nonomuraea sp. NPDC046802]|uniref:hypothetical protein n=1 Tax=Nonomuraea sp. NPDC046802 TaxID=3154919 RepID=UPI00340CE23D
MGQQSGSAGSRSARGHADRARSAGVRARQFAAALTVVRARLREVQQGGAAEALPAYDRAQAAERVREARARCRQALLLNARAHDRAAERHERDVWQGRGDPDEHIERATWHRAAARRSREAAAAIASDPGPLRTS